LEIQPGAAFAKRPQETLHFQITNFFIGLNDFQGSEHTIDNKKFPLEVFFWT